MRLTHTAAEAVQNARSNPFRSWMSGKPGNSAKERLTTGEFVELGFVPKFKLSPEWPIFTMGSCFAREIEKYLPRLGAELVFEKHGLPAELYETWNPETQTGGGVTAGKLSRGAFNKYSVHSMSHEIRRVLLDEKYDNDGLIELGECQWFDPHASGLRLASFDKAMNSRRVIQAAVAEIRRAKVVFLTMGLTETWLDTHTGLAMNVHPGAIWLNRMPERWQFVDYGFSDTYNEMDSTIQLVRRFCSPDMHFIVTVSPVPLGATAKTTDIIVANSGSKSTLRAVADELSRKYSFVDYFPSYEFVVNSPRGLAWKEDQLHVHSSMVGHVIKNFGEVYYRS